MICQKFPKLPLKTVYLEIAADWLKKHLLLAEKESKFQKQVEVLKARLKPAVEGFYDDVWFCGSLLLENAWAVTKF